jgi:hypothetical protein
VRATSACHTPSKRSGRSGDPRAIGHDGGQAYGFAGLRRIRLLNTDCILRLDCPGRAPTDRRAAQQDSPRLLLSAELLRQPLPLSSAYAAVQARPLCGEWLKLSISLTGRGISVSVSNKAWWRSVPFVFCFVVEIPPHLVPKFAKRRGKDYFSEQHLGEGLTLQLRYEPKRRDNKGRKTTCARRRSGQPGHQQDS